jgi:cytochrome c-type biogenesis protein CcmH/NrfG
MIQDIVFAVGSFLFTVALLPALFNKRTAMPWWSSLLTAAVLTVFVIGYGSLGLWLSVASGSSTAAAWWLLLIFRRPSGDGMSDPYADMADPYATPPDP